MSKNDFEFLQPDGWAAPRGYANGIVAQGRQVYIAGQIGWNARAQFESDDFVVQVETALRNIVQVLAAAGGEPRHLVRLNWYLTDKAEYVARQREIGAAYRRALGRHFPAMTLLVVAGLLEPRAKVEIEATAVIPLMSPVTTASDRPTI
ncbi:MAG: RidA family protein [Pseudolabrys sp.]